MNKANIGEAKGISRPNLVIGGRGSCPLPPPLPPPMITGRDVMINVSRGLELDLHHFQNNMFPRLFLNV